MKTTGKIFLVLISLILASCKTPESDGVTSGQTIRMNINTRENTEEFYNPDQGFYKSIVFSVTDNGIVFPAAADGTPDWKKISNLSTYTTSMHNDENYPIKSYDFYLEHKNDNWVTLARNSEYSQIYHLRFDISQLSGKINKTGDKEFPAAALTDLAFILDTFKSLGFNVIVRFAYCPRFEFKEGSPSYPSTSDFEASPEYMIRHINSVCSVLKNYEDTLTAIEVGLVGPWGEMHSTDIAEGDKSVIPDLMEAFLEGTKGTSIPILVRTPDRIYAYVYKYLLKKDLADITSKRVKFKDINNYQINASSKANRIGLFNDGYLGSASDEGTYRSDDAPRATQVAWLSKNISCRTPYGGEVINPTGNEHYKLTNTSDFNTVDEMFSLGLSYLNIGWNDKIVDYWHSNPYEGTDPTYKGKTDFTYIKNHLGYRFLVTVSKLSMSGTNTGTFTLSMKNLGFGNLNKTKMVSLLLVKNGTVLKAFNNCSSWHGQSELSAGFSLPAVFSQYKGCKVYARIDNGNGEYCLQFANQDMWDENLQANCIGTL
ncbi:MAG: DUF4832 domain-containing protein [Spirochaetales bacterium]|nr:DUF4832 domain-containing protein [Spirochaetales bacterium]